MTRVVAIGDIMGKAGRHCLEHFLPKIRAEYDPDFVVVNGENAAGGFGLTRKVYDSFVKDLGVDAVTMGNHWMDKREIYQYMDEVDRLILPANMNNIEREDRGLRIITSKKGERVAVINLIGKAFMVGENRCPFQAVDRLLDAVPSSVKLRIVDIHAEASSEKQGLAWHIAGRASLVYGTHTHVPTADERILEGKTGFATDLGMTGGYKSVIGIKKEAAIARLRTGEKKKFEPATQDPWLCALVADLDNETGICRNISRLRWEMGSGIEIHEE